MYVIKSKSEELFISNKYMNSDTGRCHLTSLLHNAKIYNTKGGSAKHSLNRINEVYAPNDYEFVPVVLSLK